MILRISSLILLTACTWGTSGPPQTSEPAPTPAGPPETTPRGTAEPLPGGGEMVRIDAAELARLVQAPGERTRVYNLWATWCGPCKAEMPDLAAFGKAHPDVALWFVNLDHPAAVGQRVERFIAEHDLQGHGHVRPAEGELDLTSQVTDLPDALPVTLVVRPDGTRHETFMGRVDPSALEAAVAAASP